MRFQKDPNACGRGLSQGFRNNHLLGMSFQVLTMTKWKKYEGVNSAKLCHCKLFVF